MKITKAFGKNILIEPMIVSQVAVSDSPSLCAYGKVLAVGDKVNVRSDILGKLFGVKEKRIKVGDTITFTVWGLNSVDFEGKKYYFVPEDDNFILSYVDEE